MGTELLIEGAVGVYSSIGMAVVVAAAINSIAILHAYFRIFTGRHHAASFPLRARPSEKVAVLVLTALIVGGGLYPQWGVASRYHAAIELIRHRVSEASASPRDPTENTGASFLPMTTARAEIPAIGLRETEHGN